MTSEKERPKVGMGVMVFRNGRILMGQRKNSHGHGEWCFPGGHLESGESFEQCILRETAEECGIKLKNIRFHCVGNVKKYERHHVLVGYVADWESGEPKVLEPDKFTGWEWFALDSLPAPIFAATRLMIEGYKNKQVCFDS